MQHGRERVGELGRRHGEGKVARGDEECMAVARLCPSVDV
jgi:hypothetical protein